MRIAKFAGVRPSGLNSTRKNVMLGSSTATQTPSGCDISYLLPFQKGAAVG
jgi:hypothetical protein